MVTLGIDPSVDHPAIASYPDGKVWQLKTKGRGAERLANLAITFRDFLLCNTPPALGAVFIERVTGRFSNPALAQASGVLQATVVNTFALQFPHPVLCVEVSPGTWKKGALGNGAAKKVDVQKWATSQGFDFTTEHEADALAIACAGHRMLEKEEIKTKSEGENHAD